MPAPDNRTRPPPAAHVAAKMAEARHRNAPQYNTIPVNVGPSTTGAAGGQGEGNAAVHMHPYDPSQLNHGASPQGMWEGGFQNMSQYETYLAKMKDTRESRVTLRAETKSQRAFNGGPDEPHQGPGTSAGTTVDVVSAVSAVQQTQQAQLPTSQQQQQRPPLSSPTAVARNTTAAHDLASIPDNVMHSQDHPTSSRIHDDSPPPAVAFAKGGGGDGGGDGGGGEGRLTSKKGSVRGIGGLVDDRVQAIGGGVAAAPTTTTAMAAPTTTTGTAAASAVVAQNLPAQDRAPPPPAANAALTNARLAASAAFVADAGAGMQDIMAVRHGGAGSESGGSSVMDDTGTFEAEGDAFGDAFGSTATALPFGERLFESKEKETETVDDTPASSVTKPPATPPSTPPAKSLAKPPATPPAATQPASVLGTFGGDASTSSIEPLSADTGNMPNPFLAAMPSVAVAASGAASGAAGAGGAGAGASAPAADTMAFAAPASPAAAVDVSSKPALTLPPHTPVQEPILNVTTPLGNHGSALMERLRRRREKNQ